MIEQLDERVSAAAIGPGMRIRWMSRVWHVDRVNSHPRWGYYFACTAEDDGSFELINSNGADGGIEVLAGTNGGDR